MISDYSGLHNPMPRFVVFLSIFSVASFGLPGTANFVGEFLVLVGTSYENMAMVLLSMGGIVLAAAYMLWMLQRVMLGKTSEQSAVLTDLTAREILTLAPLAIIVFVVGVYPGPLMEMMASSVNEIVQLARGLVPLG